MVETPVTAKWIQYQNGCLAIDHIGWKDIGDDSINKKSDAITIYHTLSVNFHDVNDTVARRRADMFN